MTTSTPTCRTVPAPKHQVKSRSSSMVTRSLPPSCMTGTEIRHSSSPRSGRP